MPATAESSRVNFEHAGQYLDQVYGQPDREPEDFVVAILQDLHHGSLSESFASRPEMFFNEEPVSAENRYGQMLRSLEWFEGAAVDLRFVFGQGLPETMSQLDVEFDLVWLNVELKSQDRIRVAPAAMRGLRSEMVTTFYDDRGGIVDRGTLEERCVLMVTIDGPGYDAPELTVLGPSKRKSGSGSEEESYAVNAIHLPFDDRADARTPADQFTNWLNSRLSDLAKPGDGWKETFNYSAETLSQARNQFRRKLKKELRETMELFEETCGTANDDELHLLRQAASLLAYRTMFLQVVERRGRLYQGPVTPARLGDRQVSRSLIDELAYRGEDVEEDTTPGAVLARLIHTVRAIRGDIEDASIAITGASIFENRPENFDPAVGSWLDMLEELIDEGRNAALLSQWDERIRKLGSIMLGHLDDEYREEVNLIGQGAHRHRHRVLGNIYEQILKMTPKREDGRLKLVVSENGDDDQSKLGAHYTPIDLVQEVVRPTLGQLFRQYWEDADGDIGTYKQRLKEMTVVDPAMGSGHFLTVAALEIAREIAWLQFFDHPRFEVLEDWEEPLLHENSIGSDPEPEENSEGATTEEVTDGQKERRESAVKEDRFEKKNEHDKFVQVVQKTIPGVIQQSIYGVDKNPLATELGKLSLWLFEVGETDGDGSRDEYPELTYLDANIRCGDSVVGVFLNDVEETVDSALRSSNSFDKRGKAMKDMFAQSESVQEKFSRTKQYREALNREDLSPDILGQDLREELDLEGVNSEYVLRERIDEALREHLSNLSWLFDLTLAVRYLGYTSGSGASKAADLYRVLFGEDPPGNSTSETKPPVESAFQTLFEDPDGAEGLEYRRNLAEWIERQSDLNAFHWELEFPSVFHQGGFDAVVSNPPFIGDRNLRKQLGSGDLVEYLANYFIDQGRKSDYSGFFFWRYNQVSNGSSVVGSLSSNSISQSSNRKYVLKPLTKGKLKGFNVIRAVPNREWPGDANVHFSAVYLSRQKRKYPALISPDSEDVSDKGTPKRVEEISSYLDEYPEYSLRKLISGSDRMVYKGFNVRGADNEDYDLAKSVGFEDDVPREERDALKAGFTTTSLQKSRVPKPTKVIVDFFAPLYDSQKLETDPAEQRNWLESKYPFLFDSIKGMKEHRAKLEGEGYSRLRNYWWRFDADAVELREALRQKDKATFFGETMKVWSPRMVDLTDPYTGLRVGPTHMVYVNPKDSLAFSGVLQSFLFEMLTRRQSSSLKSDLRFTPTDVFPFFPWPWSPKVEEYQPTPGEPLDEVEELVGGAVENLYELRNDILENPSSHGLTHSQIGGPTDLYNLYDADPEADDAPVGAETSAIEQLRQAHVDLLDAVLRAYGWDDIAGDLSREDWTFDRPWLDRSLRFVPPESVRAELFDRLDTLNSERFELEREMMIDLIAEHLPEDGLTKTGFREEEPFSEMPIDSDQFETFMEHEQQKGGGSRVRKNGYRWYSN
ncbi:Eco57I restriction-modification methylase domain-containing protein [Salinibacter ruber]|uniref:Eco57I restriction-modification methylase domain-containing protein n=1 Tax=Salinibacter ruber TaxID=146919 RepID=UPI002169513E|nr:hypothetical protein [Salinibacter ruber]MCS3642269.1 hypothetical protein [Salinibacter ruber]